jgi:hypothetical protein
VNRNAGAAGGTIDDIRAPSTLETLGKAFATAHPPALNAMAAA